MRLLTSLQATVNAGRLAIDVTLPAHTEIFQLRPVKSPGEPSWLSPSCYRFLVRALGSNDNALVHCTSLSRPRTYEIHPSLGEETKEAPAAAEGRML